MAYLVKAPRVGRSQGAVIFWGLVSAFFASAFCYYYLENRNNEERSRTLADQVRTLQDERDSLDSERDKLEAATSDSQKQLHDREEFLEQKEANLAEQEAQIEAAGSPTQGPSPLDQQQAAGVKRFDDTVRQIVARTPNADVVLRGGRPVLRLPSSIFFAPGDTQLTAGGKADLDQVAQAAGTPPGRFELRIETFTDSAGEVTAGAPPAGNPSALQTEAGGAPVDAWRLTAERAAAMAHYLRDRGLLPFQNVLAVGRAGAPPIPRAQDGSERNRRIEITLAPVAPAFRAPEPKNNRASPAASPSSAGHSPSKPDAP